MIRLANHEDLNAILAIYETARGFMAQSGNGSQWRDSYPPKKLLVEDIDREQLYVDTTDGVIHGVFAFILGPDPTYAHIEGAWINDLPYGTIHRLASDGSVRGFFSRCLNFCKERTSNLRIDTHHDNRIMQHLLEKHGFIKCGIIYVSDASPRIAYQLSEMK